MYKNAGVSLASAGVEKSASMPLATSSCGTAYWIPPCPVDMKGELLLVDNGLITRLGDNVSEVEMEWRAASRQRQIAEIRVALGGDVNRIPAPLRRPSAPEDM